jgi:hypothetical protein
MACVFGHVYVLVREWCLACDGLLDPCSGSDNIPSSPLQLLDQELLFLAASSFLCCIPLRRHFVGLNRTRSSKRCSLTVMWREVDPKSDCRVSTFPTHVWWDDGP